MLYTRGGSEDVFVQKSKGAGKVEEVIIPFGLLRMLVAEDIRASKISSLENADIDTILGGDA